MPDFETRDPRTSEFWSERFEQHFMPWDRGGVPAALRDFVLRSPAPRVALIPGCGLGHEVAFLSEAGWDVTAIDFSPAAVAAARAAAPQYADRIIAADFFSFSPSKPLDLIYERAFLCALPHERWPAVAAHWAELLPEGGLLTGFFYFGQDLKGPPFGAGPGQMDALMRGRFERIEDADVADSIPIFAGKERWQVWRRLPR